jgi:hypothetical protein
MNYLLKREDVVDWSKDRIDATPELYFGSLLQCSSSQIHDWSHTGLFR